MHKTIVVWGIGEIGSVIARGFLRLGYTVVPITRHSNPDRIAEEVMHPCMVVIAVGEAALADVLGDVPSVWRDKLVLLQNELLPKDWQQAGLINPTVISVWFEKKKGMDSQAVLASPVWGEHATLLVQALHTLDIPAFEVGSQDAMTYELVRKNVYIITTNVAGLVVAGTVVELWQEHESLARAVASDVMDIQAALVGKSLPREQLISGMLEAFAGDPNHRCMGRSAPDRLARAIALADQAGLAVSTLRDIFAKQTAR